jgi:hypothetical protein
LGADLVSPPPAQPQVTPPSSPQIGTGNDKTAVNLSPTAEPGQGAPVAGATVTSMVATATTIPQPQNPKPVDPNSQSNDPPVNNPNDPTPKNPSTSNEALPPAPKTQLSPPPSSPILIATLNNGATITATLGAPSVVIAGQTISVGTTPKSVSDVGLVWFLSSNGGLVVSTDRGSVATHEFTNTPPPVIVPTPMTAPAPIATLQGGLVVNAVPGGSSVVIGSHTVSLNGPAVTIDGHGVMSLTPTGLVVVNNVATSTYPFATAPTVTAPISTAVYGSEILTLGSAGITVPGEGVVSLSPSGIVIINNGLTTTRPLHVVAPIANTPLFTLATVFNGQTLTLNAPATFIPGIGTISLSPSGVIIINNDITITSTIPGFLPTLTLAYPLPAITVTIASETHILSAISPSTCIIDNQTLKLSGPLATVAGNQVVEFKEEGVVVQIPGGGVTTISIGTTPSTAALGPGTGIVTSVTNLTSVSKPDGAVFAGTSTVAVVSSSSTGLGEVIYNMQAGGSASICSNIWTKIGLGLVMGLGVRMVW